ncbi:hypothetical protein RND81_05G037600 [Saponaria officinalis]|uniref:Ubiquitin-like protease family profile domain-containing protein n=1 Tax=Saponaria officinalis TaxID=3572 RepID=A0AAW1KT07_SAPOF
MKELAIRNTSGEKRQISTSDESEQSSSKKLKIVSKKDNEEDKKKKMVIVRSVLEEPKEKKKKAAPRFSTKCMPGKLVELIKRLNEEQKQAVRDIGFGGLLELKVTYIPKGIMKLILSAFNYNSNMFDARKMEFLVTKDDVHDIFLLPRVGDPVELAQMGNTNDVTDNKLKNEWRRKFGLQNNSDPIMVKLVHEKLMKCNEAGEEFKRMFVMYSMSIFLAPTSNRTLDLKLVKAVQNVTRIRNFDWCSYVFNELVNSIRLCKQGGKTFVCGCILVLMLSYFHRFDFKGRVLSHSLPLIKHWDDTELSTRVDDEKKIGSLGNAPISKIEYPISLQQPEVRLTQSSDHESQDEPETEKYMKVKLPDGIKTDKQIKARAIDYAHEIYLRMRRDNELFYARYVDNMKRLKNIKILRSMDEPSTSTRGDARKDGNIEKEDDNSEKHTSTNQAPPLSQTQPVFRDPDYHIFLDGLIARSYERDKSKQGLPSFDIWTDMLKIQYKALNEKYGGCMDRELLDEGDLECNDKEKDKKVNEVCNLDVDDENQDDQENDMVTHLDDVVSKIGLGVTRSIGEYLLHSKKIPASADVVPANLGCTLDCGLPNKEIPIVSESILENGGLFDPVLKLRKKVMDYCFINDHTISKLETVSTFGYYNFLSKSDIESLLPDTKIESVVIESWAMLLNELHIKQNACNTHRRIFYGIAHTVFLPLLLEQHYFFICIDFKREKIFYLDNRSYEEDFKHTEYGYLADCAANTFADYLCSKGNRSALRSRIYPMENVPFHWQSDDINLDCGLFMMFHMLFFVGELFECDLHDKKKRELYRAEVAATLVLSDMNENRTEFLEKVKGLEEIKATLLPKLLRNRERRKQRKKGGTADINEHRTHLIKKAKEFTSKKEDIWTTIKENRKNKVPPKEKDDIVKAKEEVKKVKVSTKGKEDPIEIRMIDTEEPILRNSSSTTDHEGEHKTTRRRRKTVACSKGRGIARGKRGIGRRKK